MIIREYPTRVSLPPLKEDEDPIEITVLLISKKFIDPDGLDSGESFMVLGYDSENKIYERFLTDTKIINTEVYERKIRSPRSDHRETGSGRAKKNSRGNTDSKNVKAGEAERESTSHGNGDQNKTDGD